VYEEDSHLERNALRQGDIVSKIHLLGALNLTAFEYSRKAESEELVAWSVPQAPHFGDAIVLSHDCEIALENQIKLTSIILAPLRDMHTATEPARVQELIRSNDVRDESVGASFLKYFYLQPNSSLEFSSGAIADFSKCFSVRKNCFEKLLSRKVVQLTREAADSLALKLALYFARHRQDAA
jgi:hypothetical protein